MAGWGEFLMHEAALGQVSVRALRLSPADCHSAIFAVGSFEAAVPRGRPMFASFLQIRNIWVKTLDEFSQDCRLGAHTGTTGRAVQWHVSCYGRADCVLWRRIPISTTWYCEPWFPYLPRGIASRESHLDHVVLRAVSPIYTTWYCVSSVPSLPRGTASLESHLYHVVLRALIPNFVSNFGLSYT
jgi:hypothetical protein